MTETPEEEIDVISFPDMPDLPVIEMPQTSDPYSTDGLPYDLSSDDLAFLIRKLHPTANHGSDFWCAHKVKENSAERISPAIIIKWALAAEKPTPEEIAGLAATYADELAAFREESARVFEPVTKRQLRLTLVRNGISLAGVEAAIASMPEGLQKEEAQIEWADASTFNRNHPTLLLIASALGLTEAQVDAMWAEAATA